MESPLPFDECIVNNITFNNVSVMSVPSNPPSLYYIIPIKYRSESTDYVEELTIEACEMESRNGILKSNRNGNDKYYINSTPLDRDNFIAFLNKVYDECAKAIDKFKKVVKLNHFDINCPQARFRKPVSYELDKDTGEILSHSKPRINLAILHNKSICNSIFTDLDNNEIPWDVLTNAYIKFIPVLNFKHINITDGRPVIKIEIIRAIVTSIIIPEMRYLQVNTISRLKRENPFLPDKVKDQLSQIRKYRSQTSNDEPILSTKCDECVPSKKLDECDIYKGYGGYPFPQLFI